MISQIQLGDVVVDVVQKDIKNLHLSVHPPTGRVTISAPLRMKSETIRVFAITKLGWRHRTSFPQLVAETVEADRVILKGMGERYAQYPTLHAAQ